MGVVIPPPKGVWGILMLVEQHEELAGSEIAQMLPEEERTGVYVKLRRLEANHVLTSWKEAEPQSRTVRQRFYSLTEFGHAVLSLTRLHEKLQK